jgi:hypothetical protein
MFLHDRRTFDDQQRHGHLSTAQDSSRNLQSMLPHRNRLPFPWFGHDNRHGPHAFSSEGRELFPLVPLFFLCCFIIYFLLEVTLMPLLEASRWAVLFGVGAFLGLYRLRKRLRLDFTDGLILSMFGIAPLLMAAMLTVNFYFSEPFDETHRIIVVHRHGSSVEIELEHGAYSDFYRIRSFEGDEVGNTRSITYHFGHGPLGWQVTRGYDW